MKYPFGTGCEILRLRRYVKWNKIPTFGGHFTDSTRGLFRWKKSNALFFWRLHPEFRSATGTPNIANRILHTLCAEPVWFVDGWKLQKDTPLGTPPGISEYHRHSEYCEPDSAHFVCRACVIRRWLETTKRHPVGRHHPEFRSATGTPNVANRILHTLCAEPVRFIDGW